MADTLNAPPAPKQRSGLPATVTLAFWQLRKTWRLLLVTGAGMLAAVVFVCAVPVYTQVSMTAELRNFLNGNPNNGEISNADIAVHSTANQISPSALHDTETQINRELKNNLRPYLAGPAQFTFQMDNLSYLQGQRNLRGQVSLKDVGNRMNLYGASMAQAPAHVTLIQGRLPQANSSDIEVAITPITARGLNAVPGSVLTVQMFFDDPSGQRKVGQTLELHVVGIFRPKTDPFWHGEDFECEPLGLTSELCKVLVSNDTLLNGLNRLTNTPNFSGLNLETPPNALWYYSLVPSRIDVLNIGTVQSGLNNVLVDISNKPVDPPYVVQTQSFSPAAAAIGTYSSRTSVAQIPVTSLLFMVVALTLFFVSMMTDILVDRQSEAITILRSRGASRGHIFGSLVTQSVGLGLVALVGGPLVAILTVQLVAKQMLSAADQGALNILLLEPEAIAQQLLLSAFITVAIAIVAMIVAINGVTSQNVLSMRRQYARSTHRPLWQRFSLDIVAAIIAITGYAFSIYETSPGVLDARVRALVLPPLTLVGVVFLLLALTLFFLRIFPLLLRSASRLAVRGRSATTMLALAQMARTPRQSLRMTTLLAFSIAFAIFTLVFTASQAQRILDVANYEVGADFSGKVQGSATVAQSATYARLPGVTSATVGYTSLPRAGENGVDLTVQFLAVDADTFAKTVIWPQQEMPRPLDVLMKQLVAERGQAATTGAIPAIVDVTGWNTLHLSPGSNFTVSDLNGSVNCIAVAEVERIPTVNDNAQSGGTADYSAYGGILVDYQSYSAVSLRLNNTVPVTTDVWLRTRSDAASLAKVRHELVKGSYPLDNLNDRRAIIANLSNDPLYLGLIGVLLLGAVTAVLLALVGNLIASWLSVKSRLTSFAVLRALGTAPTQIAGVIAWEQSIVYATAIILGAAFGVLLSLMALPALVFTNVAVSGFNSDIANGQFYILQNVPPISIVVPPSLAIIFASIVAICMIALGMMVRVASRPSISQTLRLNED